MPKYSGIPIVQLNCKNSTQITADNAKSVLG